MQDREIQCGKQSISEKIETLSSGNRSLQNRQDGHLSQISNLGEGTGGEGREEGKFEMRQLSFLFVLVVA